MIYITNIYIKLVLSVLLFIFLDSFLKICNKLIPNNKKINNKLKSITHKNPLNKSAFMKNKKHPDKTI